MRVALALGLAVLFLEWLAWTILGWLDRFEILFDRGTRDLALQASLWAGAAVGSGTLVLWLAAWLGSRRQPGRDAAGSTADAGSAQGSQPPIWFAILFFGFRLFAFSMVGSLLTFSQWSVGSALVIAATARQPVAYEVELTQSRRERRGICDEVRFEDPVVARSLEIVRCTGQWKKGDRVRIEALRGPFGARITSFAHAR